MYPDSWCLRLAQHYVELFTLKGTDFEISNHYCFMLHIKCKRLEQNYHLEKQTNTTLFKNHCHVLSVLVFIVFHYVC